MQDFVKLAHDLADAAGQITTQADDSPVTIADRQAEESFITGKPLFGTLISLLHNGQPVLGVIDQPITKERWVGLQGSQSTLNGHPITTRDCGDIGNAYMYSTTPHMFAGATEQADLKPYDYMALVPVIQGAGGVITDWSGQPLCWKLSEGDVAAAVKAAPGEVLAAGDAGTHAQALQLLAWQQ
eukprot:gene4006-4257_t